MYTTDQYEGMLAETITIQGHNGDTINAYYARPLGAGPFPGVVAIHHLPGWDEWYREATRRLAHHGFATICPDLYHRAGAGTPEDVAAKIRQLLTVVPAEQLGVTTDCGIILLQRYVAQEKLYAMVEGAKIVREELGKA